MVKIVDNIPIANPQDVWMSFFRNKDGNLTRNDLAYLGIEAPEDTGEQRLYVEFSG